jgi:hypothetical protein
MRMFTQTILLCSNGRKEQKESVSTSSEPNRSSMHRVETRRSQLDECKCAFSTSVEAKRLPIDHVETRFQYSILIVRPSHVID